jgi:MFS family permease
MTAARTVVRRTFLALSVRNFRLYFIGQAISMSGTWMQSVALALLVLSDRLHGTGVDVGITIALQFVPMLLFGSFGGLVADRADKRRLLVATQISAGAVALALAVVTATGAARLWNVYLLSSALGVVNLFDNPARQTFVSEMVGPDLMSNAISLNSVIMNSARLVGPAIGGALILTAGFASCFFFNAASYAGVIVALALMRPAELVRRAPVERGKGQVREGLRYVWSRPELRRPLLVVAVVGIFAFNFTTTLPLLAKITFGGGPGAYALFLAAMGVGAVVGGLVVAHRNRPTPAMLAVIGLAFGAAILLVAGAPSEPLAVAALVLMGSCSISFVATANATLQLRADPELRGRVMALYAIALLGSTPIGGPLVGAISDASNPRIALVVGGVATLAASVWLGLVHRRGRAVWGHRRAFAPTTTVLGARPSGHAFGARHQASR